MDKIISFLNQPINLRIKIPARLLQSNIPVEKDYLQKISAEHAIERQWYKPVPTIHNTSELLGAVKQGTLVEVNETDDFLPIMRLRNPKLIDKYPRYLTRHSKALLLEIVTIWRKRMAEEGFDPKIRLAVTSMARTQEYQNQIVASGKLALSDGPHLRGEAFDIDGCGYYLGEQPVNPRQQQVGAEFEKAFKEMDAGMPMPTLVDYSKYQPRVHMIVREILDEMMLEDKIHYLHEFPGTTNTVYHIARNPDYTPKERKK